MEILTFANTGTQSAWFMPILNHIARRLLSVQFTSDSKKHMDISEVPTKFMLF